MTHLTDGVLLTHHHRVNVIPTFRNEHEDGAQNDVTNIGEKVVKVRKVYQQMVGVSAGEIVIAHVLISRCHHHLFTSL